MLTIDRAGGGGLALLALWMLLESRRLPLGSWREPGPGAMPTALALTALALGLAIVATGGAGERLSAAGWGSAYRALVIVGACVCLGYRPTVLVTLAFLVGVVERRGLLATAAFAVAVAWGSFFLFNTLLKVPLPRGPFGL
jgi:hypothetical protein